MVNKFRFNPSTGLPPIDSTSEKDFFSLLNCLHALEDLTPTERCTLLIMSANYPPKTERYYIKGLIGDLSTWYRNIKKLEKKGYLIRETANESRLG